MLVNKDAYQRETLTKWPVRLPLKDNLCNVGCEFIWNMFISNETSVQLKLYFGK